MSYSRPRLFAGALLILMGALCSSAFAAPSVECPKGFERIPSGAACAATTLAGTDGSFSAVAREARADGTCPAGFERPPGVRFCVANTMTINAIGPLLILEKSTSRFCPEGFHRQTGSSICTASNLTLQSDGDQSILIGPTTHCPLGFYQPVGSTFCVPGTLKASTNVLEGPVGLACPPGFHRPPGVAVCVAKNIVYSTLVPANTNVPLGNCPANWHRPAGVQFCIPSYEQANTSGSAGIVRGFTSHLCPSGTHEVWFDMPIYDNAGLFVIGHVPTRFCVPDNLSPAG